MNQFDTGAELQKLLEAERKRADDLERTNKAMQQEFAQASNYSETITVAKEAIKDILPLAISTAKSLIACAESESVRASLSKFVIDTVISGKLEESSDREVAELIKKLAQNDSNFIDGVKSIASKTS